MKYGVLYFNEFDNEIYFYDQFDNRIHADMVCRKIDEDGYEAWIVPMENEDYTFRHIETLSRNNS